MAFSFYVYYRVGEPTQAKIRLGRLFDLMQDRTDVRGRLLVRRDEPNMWMEVYEGIEHAPEFERVLAQSVDELGFGVLLAENTLRKLECFQESCV